MRNLQTYVSKLARDESGAALVEYSVLIGLITVAAVALIATTGATIVTKWTGLNTAFHP